MKLSDYVAAFLEQAGVKDVFLISGGGMMHLLDSVAKNKEIRVVCNLNEQASSICADSYGQYTNQLGVCMVTTGPGGTNAVTGVAASYLDSTPVLVISGQCKTADFASLRGVRQFGSQEVDIVSIVKPVTKYAVTVTKADTIRYHLEKAVYLAQHGRRGPVWIDIPLDIQGAQVEPEKLAGFDPVQESNEEEKPQLEKSVERYLHLLSRAKRPAILIGHGVIAGNASESMRRIADKLRVPMLSTWRARDVFWHDHELYFGCPGSPAPRYANYVLQNCDLLLIIGTRLNPALTVYDEPHFAFQAEKIIVDIDAKEIDKLNIKFEQKICADAGAFISELVKQADCAQMPDWSGWLAFCTTLRTRFALQYEKQEFDQTDFADPYQVALKISQKSLPTDIFVGSSSGRTCGISHMAFNLKEGQRFISSMGLGSMGFTVPSAIACAIAGKNRRVIAFEGDGSLQHNIQELQLIANLALPIKLFILSNSGYASIHAMQRISFEKRYAACDQKSNVSFPDMESVAKLYHMEYYRIQDNLQIEMALEQVMKDDRAVLCEVCASIGFDEIPKSVTAVQADGTFSSCTLENLYPFLAPQEIMESMPEWPENDV